MFKSITITISRKEHTIPSLVEEWCLPDIVFMYSSYIEEAEQIEQMSEEIKNKSEK